jgi:tetratricopeptide (TPR) repeat protein
MPRKAPPPGPHRPAEAAPVSRPIWERQLQLAPLLVSLGLFIGVLADYSDLFGKDARFFLVDDDEYVIQNKNVNTGLNADNVRWALTAFHSSNWHPLTWISLQLDSELYTNSNPDGSPKLRPDGNPELDAGSFHRTSALLHAVTGLFLMWVLTRMTGNFWRSALVAALFTLHPLRVESVAWVAERKDVLGGLFWVLTMLAYDRYVRRPGWGRYVWVVVSFTLGLIAKPLLVTLPFALLLLDYWPLQRAESPGTWKKLVVEKLPLFALSAAACVVTVLAQNVVEANAAPYYEPLPLGLRVLNAGRSYLAYIGKTIWPVHLAPMYTEPNSQFPVAWATAACIIVLTLTALFVGQRHRRPYLVVGWLWYLGTLVPMIGIVHIGIHTTCDRYTYIPHIGLFLMLVWGLGDLLKGRVAPGVLAGAAAAAVAACLAEGYAQARLWRDNVTIFEHAVNATPNNFGAHNLLGAALVREGKIDEAIAQFRRAIAIEPNYAVAHHKLGAALAQKQEWAAAAAEQEEALRLAPQWPPPKQQLALCYARLGRWNDAATLLSEVSALEPGRADLHWNLGVALLYAGRPNEAEREAREALRLNSDFFPAHQLLGLVFAVEGKPAEALAEFRSLKPELTTVFYMAWSLSALGKAEEARPLYRAALQQAPGWPEAERADAWRLATDWDPARRNGRLALLKAQVATQATEERDPKALDTLAAAQANLGNFKEAAATVRKALKLVAESGPKELEPALSTRLKLYEDGQPYRK